VFFWACLILWSIILGLVAIVGVWGAYDSTREFKNCLCHLLVTLVEYITMVVSLVVIIVVGIIVFHLILIIGKFDHTKFAADGNTNA